MDFRCERQGVTLGTVRWLNDTEDGTTDQAPAGWPAALPPADAGQVRVAT